MITDLIRANIVDRNCNLVIDLNNSVKQLVNSLQNQGYTDEQILEYLMGQVIRAYNVQK